MIRKLGTLRGVAILAIVINHAAGYGFFALTWWAPRFGVNRSVPDRSWVGTSSYYGLLSLEQLALFGVPAFLFASGSFVGYAARGRSDSISRRLTYQWIKQLFLPFFVWGSIGLAVEIVPVVWRYHTTVAEVLNLTSAYLQGMYFVPLLGFLFLIARLVIRLAQTHPVALLAGTMLFQVLVVGPEALGYFGPTAAHALDFVYQAIGGPVTWVIFFSLGLAFFFELGMILGTRPTFVQTYLTPAKWPLTAATVVLGVLSVLDADVQLRLDPASWNGTNWTLPTFLYAFALLLSLSAWQWHRGDLDRLLQLAGTRSYAIYLLSGLGARAAVTLIYHLDPRLLPEQLVFQPMVIAASLGIPMLIIALVSRSPARRYTKVLFG